MNRNNNQAIKDVERRQIDRALAALDDALSRCREEDMGDETGVYAALGVNRLVLGSMHGSAFQGQDRLCPGSEIFRQERLETEVAVYEVDGVLVEAKRPKSPRFVKLVLMVNFFFVGFWCRFWEWEL